MYNLRERVGLRNMRRVTKIKIIIFIVLVFLYNMLKQFVSPLIANELAMNQMQNTIDSNLWIQLYTYISNYSILIFIIITILFFSKDIVNLINKNNNKKENQDEEI